MCIYAVYLKIAADFVREHFDTDIGTEELGHMEMISTIVHQLTRDLTPEEIEKSGFAPYYVDHTVAVWPQAASGVPFNSCEFQSKGDSITDLHEDLAADGTTAKEQQMVLFRKLLKYS